MSERLHNEVVPERVREDRLLHSGALGVAIVSIVQLLQLRSLDWHLWVSVFRFAAAIPILSIDVCLRTIELSPVAY